MLVYYLLYFVKEERRIKKMKRIISLVLALLFIISGLQVCTADENYYYDPNYDYPVVQQPVLVPISAAPYPYDNCEKTPNIIINNHPSASASSNSGGIPVQKVVKWGVILGGLVYLYFKFGSTILGFVSAIPQKFKDLTGNFDLNSIQPSVQNIDTTRFSNFLKNVGTNVSSFLSSTRKFFVNIGDKSLREVIQSSSII